MTIEQEAQKARPMTEHDEPVEVTQADRDAAAAYWKVSRIGNNETLRRYRAGEADNSFIVQAFARHRLATRPTPSSDMVEAMARAIRQHHVTRTIYEGPGKTRARRLHSGDREAAQAAATVFAEAMAAKDAALAQAGRTLMALDATMAAKDAELDGVRAEIEALQGALGEAARGFDACNTLIGSLSGSQSIMVEQFAERARAALGSAEG